MGSHRAISTRQLKQEITVLLKEDPFESGLEELQRVAPRRAVNPLFSLLLDRDELLRWRAVTAMGAVVARLEEQNTESARVIMRRMLWMLNDESGGIGWGVPEAMGETLARSPVLAREYACMLISYCKEDGNYLEHP
ncbi:MAG: DVU0298 family protein, partial [Desulfobacterales bacterium]